MSHSQCRFRPELENLESRTLPATVPLYLLDMQEVAPPAGRLATQQGTQLATDTIPAAAGGRFTDKPGNALVYETAGLNGSYQAAGATAFNLFVDSGAYVATSGSARSAVMARLSYDFDGNGTFDRVETFNNFATDAKVGYEKYSEAKGFRSVSGTFADLRNGRIRLEVWSAFGTDATTLRTSDPGSTPSQVLIPFVLGGTGPAPLPTLSVNDVSLAEGNSGTRQATFTVRLSAASTQVVSVAFATADGSATAGQDYQGRAGTLLFNPGQTTADVTVAINGDTTVEPDETFQLQLANPTNASLADGVGLATLINDDTPPPLPDTGLPEFIRTEHDTVPVFGRAYTVQALRSGLWSDPTVWSRVPGPADSVYVPSGLSVTLAGSADVSNLLVAGTVTFADGAHLRTVNLFGMPGSSILTVGSATNVEIAIKDTPLDTGADPAQYGHGVISFGRFWLSGTALTAFARAPAVNAGDTVVSLDRLPQGWRVGDRLTFPDTRQLIATKDLRQDGPTYDQTEVVTIAAITANTVTLSRPLQFAHVNAPIADLSRSVVIRSENPAGTRGHVLLAASADVDLRYALLQDLGRTDASRPLDSARKNADGSWYVGTNQIGRYSLHLHHLEGTFNVTGNVVADGRKWGIALHDSHFGTVADNVIFRVDGAGLMTEDGSETGNRITDNLAMNVRTGYPTTHGGINRMSDTLVDTGLDGSGFWFRGPANTVVGNIAVACFTGFNYNGYYMEDILEVPTAPGQDHHDRTPVDHLTLLESRDNEALAVGIGLWITFPQGADLTKYTGTLFEGYRLTNVYGSGVEMYHTAFVTLRGFTITADPAISSKNKGDTAPRIARVGQTNTGIFAAHDAYENGGLVVQDATITGFNIGIQLPLSTAVGDDRTAPVTVLGGTFSNYVNIVAGSPMTERHVTISGVHFLPTTVTRIGTLPATPTNLWMRFFLDSHTTPALFTPSTLTLDGRSVYFLEQRPDFVIPAVAGLRPGTAGKTNAQLLREFGIAVAGRIAPTPTQLEGVIGYVE